MSGLLKIAGNNFKIQRASPAINTWTARPDTDMFVYDAPGVSTFVRRLVEKLHPTVPVYVAGSFPLWCILGKPDAWTPGDIDIFMDGRFPGLYIHVLHFIRHIEGIVITNITDMKIDIRLQDNPIPISLIFEDVEDAVRAFDLSVPSLYIPAKNMYAPDYRTAYACDLKIFHDIARMEVRAHPRVVNNVPDPSWTEMEKSAHARLVSRLRKYESRGFTAVVEDSPQRLLSLDYYSNLDKRPAKRYIDEEECKIAGDDDMACAICFTNVAQPDIKIWRCKSKHAEHPCSACVAEMFKHNPYATCPMCRAPRRSFSDIPYNK